MAIKKPKNAEITGNLDQKYWVQKADPLIAMKSVPFTLGELKILDTYISRINAADDTRRTVIFTKEEYEELMGLSCANPRALQKHIKALLSRVPELYMPDDEYISFVLFEKAYYHKDEYGKPIIELTCTETSKNLFFCIGKYHYFKYALENVINLTRKASYLLYLHILTNRYRGEWELLLDELRDEVLDCKEQASYQEYKIFKNRVLDPAVKEVNKKTDCHFTYEPVKRGRKVAKIKFIYQSQEQEQLDGQLSLLDVEEQLEGLDEESISLKRYGSKLAYFIGDIACKNEFTVEQVQVIKDLVIKIIPQNDVMERCNYVISQMNIMNAYDTQKDPIKNRFNYLRKMLEKELKGE